MQQERFQIQLKDVEIPPSLRKWNELMNRLCNFEKEDPDLLKSFIDRNFPNPKAVVNCCAEIYIKREGREFFQFIAKMENKITAGSKIDIKPRERPPLEYILCHDQIDKLQVVLNEHVIDVAAQKFLLNDVFLKFASPLQYCAFFRSNRCFKLLLVHGLKLTQDVIYFAAAGGDFEVLRMCLEEGLKFDFKAAQIAVNFFRNDVADWIMEKGKINATAIQYDQVHLFNIPVSVLRLQNYDFTMMKRAYDMEFTDLLDYSMEFGFDPKIFKRPIIYRQKKNKRVPIKKNEIIPRFIARNHEKLMEYRVRGMEKKQSEEMQKIYRTAILDLPVVPEQGWEEKVKNRVNPVEEFMRQEKEEKDKLTFFCHYRLRPDGEEVDLSGVPEDLIGDLEIPPPLFS